VLGSLNTHPSISEATLPLPPSPAPEQPTAGRRGEWEAEAAALQRQMLADALRLSAARQAGAGGLGVKKCAGADYRVETLLC